MMESIRDRLTTDGIAYSDQPRVDIRTHRSTARHLSRLAVLGFVGAFVAVAAVPGASLESALTLLVMAAVSQNASFGLRIEALEWELELRRQERESS